MVPKAMRTTRLYAVIVGMLFRIFEFRPKTRNYILAIIFAMPGCSVVLGCGIPLERRRVGRAMQYDLFDTGEAQDRAKLIFNPRDAVEFFPCAFSGEAIRVRQPRRGLHTGIRTTLTWSAWSGR